MPRCGGCVAPEGRRRPDDLSAVLTACQSACIVLACGWDPERAGLPSPFLALCGDGLLVGGVFLVYGALQVPQGDGGEQSAEPGGCPQVLDGTGQESPRGVSGAAGPVGDAGGGFEEVGEFGDARVFGYLSAPARCRVGELGDTAAAAGCQT